MCIFCEPLNEDQLVNTMSNANYLSISNCQHIEHITNIGSLRYIKILSIKNCSRLKSISDEFNNLTKLSCINCPSLICIPRYCNQLTYLNLSRCYCIEYISLNYINLQTLIVKFCSIQQLPSTIKKISYLDIHGSNITSIPTIFTNLEVLNIKNTYVNELPSTLTKLRYLYIQHGQMSTINPWLFRLRYLSNRIYEPRYRYILKKFIKYWKFKKQLKVLWKIAEYYTAKKYHPNNILKYISLE